MVVVLPTLWKDRPLLTPAARLRKQAKRCSPEVRRRLGVLLWHQAHDRNVSLTARHFGLARKTVRQWHARFDGTDPRTLEDRSRRPDRVRNWQVTPIQEGRVITLRKEHIRYGPQKLKRLYEQQHREPISAHAVYRVIKKHRLYYNPARAANARKKWQKRLPKARIGELVLQPTPGFLVSLDTVVCYWNGTKRYILTACDAASKLAFARMYTTHSSSAAADFLLRLRYLLPSIQHIHTDNGSEFAKYFDQACTYLKLPRYYSRVKTPKDNARLERFNRTLREEFIDLGFATEQVGAFNRDLLDWLIEYNFHRPHQTLGYLTPMAYAEQTTGVVPMYPNSTGS